MLQQIIEQNFSQLGYIDGILRQVSAADYQKVLALPGEPSVGKHVRHVLGHYQQLQQGLQTGMLDYRQRERQQLIETNPLAALGLLQQQLDWLATLAGCEAIPIFHYQCAEGKGHSCLLRELDFVASHTVHHLAILQIVLLQLGYQLPAEAGVHSSTLEYRRCAP
ncbi:hypothetical protein H1D31_03165 [Alishewanella sp. BS5-314]|uniref:hypothetical protein n=1 Tax=Alishewanella sp. BS5-314 TaxID=2755587 RepID=UPI0021BB4686|nr:hypothetical protein [Alishewanella sp. BS5-314]MCT8125041.1 hypothetical protein [Alishewanella sp. BS5-314]